MAARFSPALWVLFACGTASLAQPVAAPKSDPVPPVAPPAATAPTPSAEATPAPAADLPEPYLLERLMGRRPWGQRLLDSGWKFSGWTELSYTPSTVSGSIRPIGFNDRGNEFLMNQNWLRIDKPIDTEKKERQFGFRSDWILPGTDYRLTSARGLLDAQLRRGALYGIDPIQFYAQMFLPAFFEGTTVTIGRFNTPIGYESNEAISTPFVSRSYNFLFNPFTNTGITASTQLTDNFSIYGGIVTGTDVFIDPASRPYFLGGFKWAPKEGRTTVAVNVLAGDPAYDFATGFNNENCYNLVITHKFAERLRYAADFTYAHAHDVPGARFAQWYGLANYFELDITDKWTAKARGEVFTDSQGYRTGTAGTYVAATGGVTYKPTRWFQFRPEVRYDVNDSGTPFNGRSDIWTFAISAILRW